jgi:hypothetical protein
MKTIDRMIAEAEADLEQGKCGKCNAAAWQERVLFLLRLEALIADGCNKETIDWFVSNGGRVW